MRVVRIRSVFVFQRAAAPEQRRIFAGPFLPGRLLRSPFLPLVPVPKHLRFQTVHAEDLGAAYLAAVLSPVHGAINVAADPVIRARELGDVLRTRVVEIRPGLVTARSGRSVPHASRAGRAGSPRPVPVTPPDGHGTRSTGTGMDPRHSSTDALTAFIDGLRRPEGGNTPPLLAHAGGPGRIGELATGVGQHE